MTWAPLAVAVALAAAAAPAVPAAAAAPPVFDIATTAVGVAVQSTQSPAASVVTAGLVDSTDGYATSALSSYGAAESLASALYPGNLIDNGPALLCANFLPCPTAPPADPLLADASYPTHPSASAPADGSPAGAAHATASEKDTAATASAAGGSSTSPVAVRVDGQTVSTHGWVDATGAHVRSRSVLHGVTIGPLAIASLDATDAVDVAADGTVHDVPEVTVLGVSFAGQSASIDSRGVHVAGHDQGLPDRQLAQQGLAVRLIGTGRQDIAGAARSTAGGLLLTFSVPVRGVPDTVPGIPTANRTYLGTVTVGGAGAVVAASTPGSLTLPALPPPAAGSAGAVFPAAPSLPGTPPGAALALPSVAGAQPPTTAQPPGLPPLARLGLQTPDLRTLALLLALVPLALLALWRAAVRLTWRTR